MRSRRERRRATTGGDSAGARGNGEASRVTGATVTAFGAGTTTTARARAGTAATVGVTAATAAASPAAAAATTAAATGHGTTNAVAAVNVAGVARQSRSSDPEIGFLWNMVWCEGRRLRAPGGGGLGGAETTATVAAAPAGNLTAS